MGKVALIFGGSGGIGKAVEREFKKAGITVYITSRQKISNPGPYTLFCDVTKISQVKKAVSAILKKESGLDFVINSTTPPLKLKTIENLTTRDFKQDIDTILMGGINIGKAVIPAMKTKRSGIIINILSSVVSGGVSTRMSSYISAKYGLLGFTKSLALELKPFGIFVFGLSPSYVETKLIKAFPEKLIEIEKEKRNGNLLSPGEVAKKILNIIQNPKPYKSGENIEIS